MGIPAYRIGLLCALGAAGCNNNGPAGLKGDHTGGDANAIVGDSAAGDSGGSGDIADYHSKIQR